jgi:hypothetical protein
MQLRTSVLAAAAAFALAGGAAHAADVRTINGAPGDGFHYGAGNNYSPANALVLTTDGGDELDLRFHQTFVTAPASTGDTYSFALGTSPISFDWGIDTSGTGSFSNVTATITVFRLGVGNFSYDPFFVGNDNSVASGSAQNSARLNWFPIGFDPNVDSTYKVQLTVNGLSGGTKTLSGFAKVGAGADVPEPATWAMLVAGFGLSGAMLRRRAKSAATA